MPRIFIFFFLLVLQQTTAFGQFSSWFGGDDEEEIQELLMDRKIQIETTTAINNMYNFKFYEADREFKWLLVKYPKHPIGHFLLGLSDWWKIVPDTGDESFDSRIHGHMDKTIDRAEDMLDQNANSKEAAFFIAAAYAFKGRLYAERENWVKSAWAGKQALKYLEKSRGDENINPELLFGDGLYNFYSKWIHENYKSLKPLLTFFRKGDKQLGIAQLENVSQNAFYTRMEARYFLVQIYAMENKNQKALRLASMMHAVYPDNSFFHRYAARSSFALGRMNESERYAKELLDNIEAGKEGYGANEGRYGAYMMGYIYKNYKRNPETARFYYLKCLDFAKQNNTEKAGYSVSSLLALGDIEMSLKNYTVAQKYYQSILDLKDRKSSTYKAAKEKEKEIRKLLRKS
ncbi:tetratricopeptide repeat protein [Jiulongibacter sp. NS-SX5]|uniref:tetratricopeptide repeat protein n=1 Tax=Jiulongibacter sp. NS-SX5 TaxID=3463854 RepID=UPI004058C9F6